MTCKARVLTSTLLCSIETAAFPDQTGLIRSCSKPAEERGHAKSSACPQHRGGLSNLPPHGMTNRPLVPFSTKSGTRKNKPSAFVQGRQ